MSEISSPLCLWRPQRRRAVPIGWGGEGRPQGILWRGPTFAGGSRLSLVLFQWVPSGDSGQSRAPCRYVEDSEEAQGLPRSPGPFQPACSCLADASCVCLWGCTWAFGCKTEDLGGVGSRVTFFFLFIIPEGHKGP